MGVASQACRFLERARRHREGRIADAPIEKRGAALPAEAALRFFGGAVPGEPALLQEFEPLSRRIGEGGGMAMLPAALPTVTDQHVAHRSLDLEPDRTAQASALAVLLAHQAISFIRLRRNSIASRGCSAAARIRSSKCRVSTRICSVLFSTKYMLPI